MHDFVDAKWKDKDTSLSAKMVFKPGKVASVVLDADPLKSCPGDRVSEIPKFVLDRLEPTLQSEVQSLFSETPDLVLGQPYDWRVEISEVLQTVDVHYLKPKGPTKGARRQHRPAER